jgi:hypothetical protein
MAVEANRSGFMIMAAIGHVFTISRVAEMLSEDEDRLYELSIDMSPENGCQHVYGAGDDGATAFTDYGVECLRQIIEEERHPIHLEATFNAP